jgi:hypothetical protein
MKAGAYIIDPKNKKILVILGINKLIGIPKGSVEKDKNGENRNESLLNCAIREVYEEAGIDITNYINKKYYIIMNENEYYYYVYIDNGSNIYPNDKLEPKNKHEIMASRWVDLDFLKKNINHCNRTLKNKSKGKAKIIYINWNLEDFKKNPNYIKTLKISTKVNNEYHHKTHHKTHDKTDDKPENTSFCTIM